MAIARGTHHARTRASIRSDSDDGRGLVITSSRCTLQAKPISVAENREQPLRNPLPAGART
jgi:hypothetical protein